MHVISNRWVPPNITELFIRPIQIHSHCTGSLLQASFMPRDVHLIKNCSPSLEVVQEFGILFLQTEIAQIAPKGFGD